MSALPPVPSPLTNISLHAIERFCERVIGVPLEPASGSLARIALYRMYRASRPATWTQLCRLHVKIDRNATYLLSDSGYGLYILIIKEGELVTLWKLPTKGDQR